MTIKQFAIALGLTLLSTFNALASDDLTIDAQEQDLNFKKNTMFFKGNVQINQGSMKIKADELYVITKDGAAEKLIAKGSPATFSQSSSEGEELEANATEVIYLVNERILELKGSAKYRQGGSVVDSANGNITFDLENKRVKAVGGTENNGRVTTTIKIKPKTNNEKDSGND